MVPLDIEAPHIIINNSNSSNNNIIIQQLYVDGCLNVCKNVGLYVDSVTFIVNAITIDVNWEDKRNCFLYVFIMSFFSLNFCVTLRFFFNACCNTSHTLCTLLIQKKWKNSFFRNYCRNKWRKEYERTIEWIDRQTDGRMVDVMVD